jgi:hypothetical protein
LIDFRGKTKKDIIIASNFDYMQLEAYYGSEMYGPSIVSRLGGMCGKAWVLGGPDRRLKEFTEEANFLTEEDI